jgi:hypothetical protein
VFRDPWKNACPTSNSPGSEIRPWDLIERAFVATLLRTGNPLSSEHKSSENPIAKDYGEQQFMFGDVGMIYVWFCFDCLTPLATMDCY